VWDVKDVTEKQKLRQKQSFIHFPDTKRGMVQNEVRAGVCKHLRHIKTILLKFCFLVHVTVQEVSWVIIFSVIRQSSCLVACTIFSNGIMWSEYVVNKMQVGFH
jgi:hypothetical protein